MLENFKRGIPLTSAAFELRPTGPCAGSLAVSLSGFARQPGQTLSQSTFTHPVPSISRRTLSGKVRFTSVFTHLSILSLHVSGTGEGEGRGSIMKHQADKCERLHVGLLRGRIRLCTAFRSNSRDCISLYCFNWKHCNCPIIGIG